MPIYEQTYKPWEAHYGGHRRWLIVMRQELRVANTAPLFRRLLLLSLLPFLLFVFVLLVVNLMTASPSQLIRSAIEEIKFSNVDAPFFRLYLWMTMPFVFLFCLYLGGGSVCSDYQHNLLEVYFAKPLTRLDYFIGKLAAVCFVPLIISVGLCWLLILLHVVMSPTNGFAFLQTSWWVPFSALAWSLSVILPYALITMACSAVSKTTASASIIACAILFTNSAVGNALSEITRRPNIRCLSLTRCMLHLSDLLWGTDTRITLPWEFIVAGMAAVCLVCVVLIFRRIRAVEITS
jgi:ABC-type transport system involved in multi-copper enzyme maturation permease subunit